jgi:hypothetical protein
VVVGAVVVVDVVVVGIESLHEHPVQGPKSIGIDKSAGVPPKG